MYYVHFWAQLLLIHIRNKIKYIQKYNILQSFEKEIKLSVQYCVHIIVHAIKMSY